MKRRIKSADEQDVFTGWRRLYSYTQRAGVCHKVKRRARRRERHEARREIQTTIRLPSS